MTLAKNIFGKIFCSLYIQRGLSLSINLHCYLCASMNFWLNVCDFADMKQSLILQGCLDFMGNI